MTRYYASLTDETGEDFSAEFEAKSNAKAWERVKELYPESRCYQLETRAQMVRREARDYRWSVMAMDNYEGDY
jgi:hypothetical protein